MSRTFSDEWCGCAARVVVADGSFVASSAASEPFALSARRLSTFSSLIKCSLTVVAVVVVGCSSALEKDCFCCCC